MIFADENKLIKNSVAVLPYPVAPVSLSRALYIHWVNLLAAGKGGSYSKNTILK